MHDEARRPDNRLANETSPYLLSHAHNPVDWYPWGEEALAKARAEDKPIFLSIGYSACHWCHVMERESFEDEEVARLLGAHFVAIKVDREERPDLDAIYMAATVAMNGSGGWPMSVFLTPSQAPFFAGTYFPKESRYGRPGFLTVLERIAELWASERGTLLEQARELTRAVRAEGAASPGGALDASLADGAALTLAKSFDPTWGGFGGAPKFPAPFALSLLMRHHHRTGSARSLEIVKLTLRKMADGGLQDHLAGGFARYSTDTEWHVPHFEKMLYDNAQLATCYLEAWQLTAEAAFREVAERTLDYLARERRTPEGGFASATDADSEGVEGRYFVWTRDELDVVLGEPAAARFALAYDVSREGNWEAGKNVLRRLRPLDELSSELGLSTEALAEELDQSRARLLEARGTRVAPASDDKVLTAWTGLAIRAFARASRAFARPDYLRVAEQAAAMILERLARPDGGLFRAFRAGRAHVPAFLEDYACFGDALVDLYEATGEHAHLAEALRLAERAVLDFDDPATGGLFDMPEHSDAALARMQTAHDGATPSGVAVAARLLSRLAEHTGRDDLRARAEAALRAHGATIARHPRMFCTALELVERWSALPVELVIVGPRGSSERAALLRAASEVYLPHATLVLADPSVPPTRPHPLLEGRLQRSDRSLAYLCSGGACQAPAESSEALQAQLAALRSSTAGVTDRGPAREPS